MIFTLEMMRCIKYEVDCVKTIVLRSAPKCSEVLRSAPKCSEG